jgi:hypothetical protein
MPHLDPEANKRCRARIRERNASFVREINARTACAHCGAQPIEWHNPEHVELGRQLYRISSLVRRASLASIATEIARCTPLCRRCHMAEDGRMNVFMVQARRSKTQPPKPCQQCSQLAKPLRRGLCGLCSGRVRSARMTPEQIEKRREKDRQYHLRKKEAAR